MGELFTFFDQNAARIGELTLQHLWLTFLGISFTIAIGLPLGMALSRTPLLAEAVVSLANIAQTVPTLAVLILMVPLVGIGTTPAILAVVLRAVLPLIKNTYTGIVEVSSAVIESGRGMGMTERQILFKVQLPLAMPVILAGVRSGIIMAVGLATLGAAIGAGGLGDLIFAGIALRNDQQLLAGAIPVALLAIALDGLCGLIERASGRATARA